DSTHDGRYHLDAGAADSDRVWGDPAGARIHGVRHAAAARPDAIRYQGQPRLPRSDVVGRPARRGVAGAGAGCHGAAQRTLRSRQFIAVATTGFVLMTLFVNGISLRPLIRKLHLNELPLLERVLRNQAVVVALEDIREKTDRIADREHIGNDARQSVDTVFDATQASIDGGELASLKIGR